MYSREQASSTPGVVTVCPRSKRGGRAASVAVVVLLVMVVSSSLGVKSWSGPICLSAAVNQPRSGNRGFAVVHGQIAGHGVIVDVILQMRGDFPKEAVIDKLLGQLT